MSILQDRRFTFSWQIMNFSMCPQKSNQSILSPIFVTEMLGNSEWQLIFYPKGKVNENGSLSCYLCCRNTGCNINTTEIGFAITIYSDDAKKRITKEYERHVFEKDGNRGFHDIIPIKDLFNNKEAYLLNDTLSIKCSIWRNDDSEIQKDDSSTALTNEETSLGSNAQNYEQCDECSIVTRVEVHSKSISWSIKNFSSLRNERLAMRVSSAIKDTPSFRVTFFKSIVNQSVEIEIKRQSHSLEQALVKCKASVFQIPKDVKFVAEGEHLFDSGDILWKFPSFIKFDELEEVNYFDRSCDVLHLHFKFSFSQLGGMYDVEKASFRQCDTLVNFYEPRDEFSQLYKNLDVHDVVIRVGDRDFKVLKSILKARSPVLSTMFDNEMKEKKTGVVDISDVDADTFDRMVTFMYKNSLEDLQAEDAIRLYSAADKYQILSLKFRCTWILASCIRVSNVCEVLTLADRHSDVFLRECAESFVRSNSMEVFKSEEWLNFIQNNGTVAANVMVKMLKI